MRQPGGFTQQRGLTLHHRWQRRRNAFGCGGLKVVRAAADDFDRGDFDHAIAQDRARFEEVCNQARAHFSDEELVKLMIAVVTINAWNRFTAFGDVAGSYKPRHFVTESKQAATA